MSIFYCNTILHPPTKKQHTCILFVVAAYRRGGFQKTIFKKRYSKKHFLTKHLQHKTMYFEKAKMIAAAVGCLWVGAVSAQSDQNERTVKTQVQKATVYLQGAQLSSTETVSLPAGITNVIFEGVSPNLVPTSLQAIGKGSGDFIVMDVRYNLKYVEMAAKKPLPAGAPNPERDRFERDLSVVKDSLTDIGFLQQSLNYQKNNLASERSMLIGNNMMKGTFKRDSLPLFTQSLDFLRARLNNIDGENLKLDREVYRVARIVKLLNNRAGELQQLIAGNYPKNPVVDANPKPVSQAIVTIQCETAMVAQINLSYFVANAGWTASYDLRGAKESANIELRHKAAVYQNTGVEWRDVQLTLSTGNPNVSNTKPVLSPFYVRYDQPYVVYDTNRNNVRNAAAPTSPSSARYDNDNEAAEKVAEYAKMPPPPRDASDFVTVNNGMLRVEYDIKLRYNIDSDNKPHNVAIQNKTMPTLYTYSVIPKLDLDAFLIARITGWEDMNLMAGTARIYFDGSFVGETAINPSSTSDTMQLNLGRDKSIAVTRIKIKEKSKEKILSDNKFVTKNYEIQIRNTKNTAIRIVVEDQIPVTQDNTIKIEKTNDSNATHNPNTGKLTWDFNLRGRDTKTLTFGYEITYPKDKQVSQL